MDQKIYVANWKMYLTVQQELAFFNNYAEELTRLKQVVICPSFLSLAQARHIHNQVLLGAQDCSAHEIGAYTGQISAQSLAETGCSFCIIGHSERRQSGDTTDIIKQKIQQALQRSLTPIICIGETAHERTTGLTQHVLEAQLRPLVHALPYECTVLLAYEPVWAIGTGTTPTSQELEETCSTIRTIMHQHAPSIDYKLLYGGSVTSNNAAVLKAVVGIDGFLIGKASTDFQELKKIVSC